MSIVYDYLKQIQEKKEPTKTGPVPSREPQKKVFFSGWIKTAVILLICLGIGLGVYFLAPHAVKPITKLYHAPEADAPEDIPMMRSSEPACALEGIIYNPSQPFAIINGKMLETHGTIGDFEVTKITPDSVVIQNTKDQTTRTLHL